MVTRVQFTRGPLYHAFWPRPRPLQGAEGQGHRLGLGWVAQPKRSQAEQRKLWQVWTGGPSWFLAVTTGTRKGEAGTDGQSTLP